ncbi:MAG: hypothetical protein DRP45_10410 [Candidatus Zixiibacteriota bacterium]|nr:MAG: hypothetical protein DRP45_10410 [candidate division Zixibacteria bacterium]
MTGAEAMMVVSALGTAYSIKSSMDAAKSQDRAAAEAERMGRENAANIEAETQRSKTVLREEQMSKEGEARAKAAASGATVTGSLGESLDYMGKQHRDEIAWLGKSGTSRANLAKLEGGYQGMIGRNQASSTRAGAIGSAISGAGTTYGYGKEAGWFGT